MSEPEATTPHDRFFYQQGGRLDAVRSGDWKLFVNGKLYNLKIDPAEKINVAKPNAKIVQQLQGMLDEFAADIKANARPVGVVSNSRTLVPRPGVEGDKGYLPTLSLGNNK